MAASMLATATVATIDRAAPPTQVVSPYTGLRPNAQTAPRRSRLSSAFTTNGGRFSSNSDMLVWPPEGKMKLETLSYLPDLSRPALAKQIDYLLRNGWIPCLEFDKIGFIRRENNRSPGYYDGRYWTMWKLPMFGCTDSSQVLRELDNCIKEYPNYFVRIIGFDNKRQAQCVAFVAYKPPWFKG